MSYHYRLRNMQRFELHSRGTYGQNEIETFDFIGQLKISHIKKCKNIDAVFHEFIDKIAKEEDWGAYLLEVYIDYNDRKDDTIAFLTLSNNVKHLDALKTIDEKWFMDRRLACKPNGFTNEPNNRSLTIRYRQQRDEVTDFNERHYPGSLNARSRNNTLSVTPSISTTTASVQVEQPSLADVIYASISRSASPAAKRKRDEAQYETKGPGYGHMQNNAKPNSQQEPNEKRSRPDQREEARNEPVSADNQVEKIQLESMIMFGKLYNANAKYDCTRCKKTEKMTDYFIHKCQFDVNNNALE